MMVGNWKEDSRREGWWSWWCDTAERRAKTEVTVFQRHPPLENR
jgi:hypothetical protein